jgi:hypothetical protein
MGNGTLEELSSGSLKRAAATMNAELVAKVSALEAKVVDLECALAKKGSVTEVCPGYCTCSRVCTLVAGHHSGHSCNKVNGLDD